jgi:hypothetical protein
MPLIVMTSSPVRPSESADSPAGNCKGRMPIPMRFERWIRSKLWAITARTPEQAGALGGPVARRAGAVLGAGEHDEGDASGVRYSTEAS